MALDSPTPMLTRLRALSRNGALWLDWSGPLLLGLVAYVLLARVGSLTPLEGAVLLAVAAGLIRVGLRWISWYRTLLREGFLVDYVEGILRGDRALRPVPPALPEADRRTAEALEAVLRESDAARAEHARLREAALREWHELDGLLQQIQRDHAFEAELKQRGGERLAVLGRDLKAALERTLDLDRVELNHRLRADQHRTQGQAFSATLEQVQQGLEQFETLLEELQDSFPRLRREEDALGRLADAGLRQGARLALAVKGLVAHTPRLVEDTQARLEALQRFRKATDEVRDQTEALTRRLEAFRDDAQLRVRAFGEAQAATRNLDLVAQQAGLLAVNASILAQQAGGNPALAEIGSRLRTLADRTAEGTSDLERMLDQHQRGLDRETAALWEVQDVSERLLTGIQDLLRSGQMLDRQGHDLERSLEAHLGLVDQARQGAERAELSLHEVGERALALEAAHGRQWGVEAKLAPERERLARVSARLGEMGRQLAHASQQNLDDLWDVLCRHQELRRSEVYREVTSEGLPRLFAASESSEAAWNRVAWARFRRRHLEEQGLSGALPQGWVDGQGCLHLRILGLDALNQPEPSAIESWDADTTGQNWHLALLGVLRTEDHRLALLDLFRQSPLPACYPGLDMRVSPVGLDLRLPYPHPGFPAFLAGLGLALPLHGPDADLLHRPEPRPAQPVATFLWAGPGADARSREGLRLVHGWIREDPDHAALLTWLPYPGPRPPCPRLEEEEGHGWPAEKGPALRCLGLGVDAALLHPLRDRLLAEGAVEGDGGITLCAVEVGYPHPEALLLRLFQADAGLAGAGDPVLMDFQARLRDDVLSGAAEDPYLAAWMILEDLQKAGWLLPLPARIP